MSVTERRTGGLGRGLASLIPQRPAGGGPAESIDRVRHNPFQPRQSADVSGLESLADSIRAHGVLQPIVVIATLDGFQLIAGERRLRAAQMAGLERIPATVREADEQDQLELALVENLQRTDLNPVEAATAYPPAHRRIRPRRRMESPAASAGPDWSVRQYPTAARPGGSRGAGGRSHREARSVKATLARSPVSTERSGQLTGPRLASWSAGLSVRQTEELVRAPQESSTDRRHAGRKPRPRPGATRDRPSRCSGDQGHGLVDTPRRAHHDRVLRR